MREKQSKYKNFHGKHLFSCYFSVKGVYLKHTINQMQCTYAIGATTNDNTPTVLCCTGFDPCGTGEDIWAPLRMKGCFENECKEH